MRVPRRWINRVLGFGLLGLATTVAVAWALAAWAPHRATRVVWYAFDAPAGSGAERYVFSEYRGRGFARLVTQTDVRGPVSQPGVMHGWTPHHASDFEHRLTESGDVPRWPRVRRVLEESLNPREAEAVTEDRRGWPLLALGSRLQVRWDGPPDGRGGTTWSVVRGGHRISSRPGPNAWDAGIDAAHFRALPLLPLWGGLALNTVFYAACWAGLVYGVAWLCGSLRRSRGLCPRCAYELGQAWRSGCPECGWLREKAGPRGD